MKWIKSCSVFLVCLFLFSSCETPLPPLGGKVDKNKSGHFYIGVTRRKIYCKRRLTNMSLLMIRYEPVKSAHAGTFTVIDELTGYDKHAVYYRTFRQKNIDRASFYINTYGMVCDEKGVYTTHYCGYEFQMFPVDGADPATFHLLRPLCENRAHYLEWAKDESAVFMRIRKGKSEYGVGEDDLFEKQTMDAASFEIVNHKIAIDKDSLYFVVKNRLITHPRMPGRLEVIGPYVWNGDSIYQTGIKEDEYEQNPVMQNDSIIGYVRENVYGVYAIEVKDPESVRPEFDVADYTPDSYGPKRLWIDNKLYDKLKVIYEPGR